MDDQFFDAFQPRAAALTEHVARVEFVSACGQEASIRGTIQGPYCEFARTLATTHEIDAADRSATIVDPCYWTPELPFLYRLRAEVAFDAAAPAAIDAMIGLRRWEAVGANLVLDRKRTVLRGAAVEFEELVSLDVARACAAALIMRSPSISGCANASRRGVPVVADLRGEGANAVRASRALAWQSSVVLAIIDADASPPPRDAGLAILAATTIRPDDGPQVIQGTRAAVIAVELGPADQPPTWLASCGKPVVAIRRGVTYESLADARAECDWLQSQLAPQFNLAGYFVSRA